MIEILFDGFGQLQPFDLLLIFLSSWGVTYGIVSGTIEGEMVNQKEIMDWPSLDPSTRPPMPPTPIYANSYYGQTDGKSGFAKSYWAIRRFLGTSKREWIREASYCRICVSFSVGLFFAFVAMWNNPISDLVMYGVASHGAIVTYTNIIRVTTGILPNDF